MYKGSAIFIKKSFRFPSDAMLNSLVSTTHVNLSSFLSFYKLSMNDRTMALVTEINKIVRYTGETIYDLDNRLLHFLYFYLL